jgi:2-oxo-3-hexenedioate decarboxylase
MLDASRIAADLATAERERRSLAPFTDAHPELDEETGYAAQWAGVQARLDAGERLVGAKLGLTSRIKQQVMKVDSPLYGWVTGGMLHPYGEPVELATLIHPRVEPEIAFLLGRDVETPATVTSVLAATESVFGAVDVLDSRYEDFRFTLPDVVADNASAGLFLLGPTARRPADLVDLRLLGCVLRVDGDVTATAAGAATMGHPAAAVAWLANRLANRPGNRPVTRQQRLTAGMLVFSGGLTEPVPLALGSSVTAEFDGLGAIEVTCR